MRALPAGLAAHLASGVTTLCRCWTLERADGVVLGFTDHDEALAFEGVVFSATDGLAATGDVTKTGLGVGGFEIAGALSSAGLTADDLAEGRYDFATVTMWVVNWADAAQRVVVRRGTLAEVTRADGAFRAEVRGPSAALETVRGRVFGATCDADLGDGRCRVDLAAVTRTATVVRANGPFATVSGLDAVAGFYADGVARVLDGAEAGFAASIAVHGVDGAGHVLRLRQTLLGLAAGDRLAVSPGCDKRFATCLAKFANGANFRGFPHLPGNDKAFGYARSGA